MKQPTNQVITRMTSEFNDLTCRLNSLERFLITEDFTEVSDNQKALLAQQHTAMEQYKEILLSRLVDLRNQEKREKEMTCAPAHAEKEKPVSTDPAKICCTSCKWAGPDTNEELVECKNPKADFKTCWEAKDGTPAD